ncbi:hypothetical protein B0T42_13390 [Rathayibacter sp. VKM Ac-2630]|nr:hypothetical protein B0T42_13390 [Rathayibacter sp. VKM Ac-2630]
MRAEVSWFLRSCGDGARFPQLLRKGEAREVESAGVVVLGPEYDDFRGVECEEWAPSTPGTGATATVG